ncbi:MAG: redoxin domain-containing protein [Phycisphaeraceae bacterium]|nr:redoxin domain-containing protein [Phycisphaeraceae bacterium]
MSHKTTRCILIGALLITQAAWSQTRPGATSERSRALRGRTSPQRNMQDEMAKQLTDVQSQIRRIQAEQRKFNTDLNVIHALATEEEAAKTLDKINQLIKTRNTQYRTQLNNLNQKVMRIKTALTSVAKRNQAENRIDTVAPPFSAKTVTGEKVTSSQNKGKVIVLEWLNPECQFTRLAYQRGKVTDLARQYANHKDVTWLGVCSARSNRPASLLKFIETHRIKHPVINDATGQMARLYYAKATPQFIIIGKDGKIAYSGAFDNSLPKPKDGKVTTYVANALTEILQGQPVTLASIPPAGTPIKADRR